MFYPSGVLSSPMASVFFVVKKSKVQSLANHLPIAAQVLPASKTTWQRKIAISGRIGRKEGDAGFTDLS